MAPADVIKAFYSAINNKDVEAISAVLGQSFHEDAAVEWPKGLPYGGRIEGSSRLAKVFGGMAKSPAPVGPGHLELVGVLDGGDSDAVQRAVAILEFDWYAPGSTTSTPSSALELWTFRDGLVAEVRAYYWDTAELQSLTRAAAAVSAADS